MDTVSDKAKGAALAVGLLLLFAWPFIGLAYSLYVTK